MGLTTTGNRATTRYVARFSLVASLATTLLVLPGLMSAHPGKPIAPTIRLEPLPMRPTIAVGIVREVNRGRSTLNHG
jgi:hypothetical protein